MPKLDAKHTRTLQREINRTLHNAKCDWLKIPIDGKPGPLTYKHARIAGSWQGLTSKQLHDIGDHKVTDYVFEVLTHRRDQNNEMKRRHHKREKHFKELRHHHKYPPEIEGLVHYDGEMLPGWIAAINDRARKSGKWKGEVISGVRSPEYSEHLCIIMCGEPSCPGRCAGRSSNHACPPSGKGVKYEGAEDVTDPEGLREFCREHNEPLIGGGEVLGTADLNHFSHSGR